VLDTENFKAKASDDTRIFREYIVKESLNQYKDYYETDSEELPFFEFIDNITNRDKIRFMEVFKDYT